MKGIKCVVGLSCLEGAGYLWGTNIFTEAAPLTHLKPMSDVGHRVYKGMWALGSSSLVPRGGAWTVPTGNPQRAGPATRHIQEIAHISTSSAAERLFWLCVHGNFSWIPACKMVRVPLGSVEVLSGARYGYCKGNGKYMPVINIMSCPQRHSCSLYVLANWSSTSSERQWRSQYKHSALYLISTIKREGGKHIKQVGNT